MSQSPIVSLHPNLEFKNLAKLYRSTVRFNISSNSILEDNLVRLGQYIQLFLSLRRRMGRWSNHVTATGRPFHIQQSKRSSWTIRTTLGPQLAELGQDQLARDSVEKFTHSYININSWKSKSLRRFSNPILKPKTLQFIFCIIKK